MTNPAPTTARRSSSRAWLTAVVVATSLALVTPSSATAQEGPEASVTDEAGAQFSVQPSGPDGPGNRDWFTYTLDPASTFGDVVAVSNLSDRPIRFALFATDAVNVADVGGFAALRDDEAPVGVGSWITLAADRYTVEPGQRIDVPFRITVPRDAEPGDHAGAILAVDVDEGLVDPATAPDGVSFNVRHRLGARVYVRVNGPTEPALRIAALSVDRDGGTATVNWDVENIGNLRLTPTAQVRITGWLGRTVRTLPVQELPELLPDANYVGAAIATGLPRFEPLTAHLVVEAEGVRTKRSTQFASYPWLLIALVVLVVVLAGWWYRRRRRLHRSSAPSRPAARVPASV